MACLVCDHSKRFAIETALRDGTPKLKVAKIFNIRRQTLQDHIRFKHEEKSPAKPPDPSVEVEEEVHALPTDAQIRRMHSRRERLAYVERLIEDRKFFGSETMARLIRLWRETVHQDTAIHVAELFAEALKRQTFARGPKAIRRQFAMAEYLSMSRACRESGDNKTALAAFDKYVELDNLKEDPVAIHKQILAQYIQIVQVGAPHLLPHIQAVTAQIEEGCDRAIAVLEGEIPPQMPLLSPVEEPMQEAPPTPRSNEAQSESGIDTGSPPSDSIDGVPSSE